MEKMENVESVIIHKGTNPFLTALLFGAIIAGVVTSGNYFSKQRVAAKEIEAGFSVPLNTFSFAALGHRETAN